MKHRCKTCNKLLAVGVFSGSLNIKCPRCHVLNQFCSLTTENAHERQTLEHETHGQTAKTLRSKRLSIQTPIRRGRDL